MKRVLFILSQPPGTSGVQAYRWSKMLPFLHGLGWSIDFVGPDPELNSVLVENMWQDGHSFHFTRNLPYSRQFAIKRNRHRRNSLLFWLFAIIQYALSSWERLTKLDENVYLANGLFLSGRQALSENRFDLVCASSPPFFFLEQARLLALATHLPYLVLYDDPHGARNVEGFWPSEPEKQRSLLSDADCVVFASPLTRERYVEAGLVPEARSVSVTDSYPTASQINYLSTDEKSYQSNGTLLLHLGNLPPWRNIDKLLNALHRLMTENVHVNPIYFDIYGHLYPEALSRVNDDPLLAPLVRQLSTVSNVESHQLASKADILLIVIGSRHKDNLPSKMFEYMAHPKPLLVIGPKGNPLQMLLADIPIGVFCDIDSVDKICAGLKALINHREEFVNAYITHAAEIERFSAESVAKRWISYFEQAIATHQYH